MFVLICPMLFDKRQRIYAILGILADEIRLSALRVSEDARNEALAQKFRDIHEQFLNPACELAEEASEKKLEEAVRMTNEGLIRIFEIEKRMMIYPLIYADKTGRYEIIKNEKGEEVKNYDLSILFKEESAIHATVNNITRHATNLLYACGADMTPMITAYKRAFKSDIIDHDNIFPLSQLRLALQNLATRISPYDMQKSHPNYQICDQVRSLDYRIETAGGGGLVATIIEIVDPTEALMGPPIPAPELVELRYDQIFSELHAVLKNGLADIAPLRPTPQCIESIRGSFETAAKSLRLAVDCLEESGMEFPQYHAALAFG
jgi:hypothetical protein